jgi:hypothetical protein
VELGIDATTSQQGTLMTDDADPITLTVEIDPPEFDKPRETAVRSQGSTRRSILTSNETAGAVVAVLRKSDDRYDVAPSHSSE